MSFIALRAAFLALPTLLLSEAASAQWSPPILPSKPPKEEAIFYQGGPFYIDGPNVVACGDPEAALMLNDPERDAKYGRATLATAMQFGRCLDYPDGLPILILNSSSRGAQVIPDASGPSSIKVVPLSAICGRNCLFVDLSRLRELPRLTRSQATSQR